MSSCPASERSSRAIGCEIIAALMKGDRTTEQLCQVSGASRPAVERWLGEMRRSGLVWRRRSDAQTPGRGGRWPLIHCLQAAPFEREDWA